MAIDQNAILQFLMQAQGGGSPPATPVSGIGGGTPLSGLMLGEQGMGLGGGGGMLAGQGGDVGQPMGGGVDISQLLAMLQGAGGGGVTGIGGGGLTLGQGGGGAIGAGFGTGGQLLPQQSGMPQGTLGQAGMSGSQSAATVLGTIKELLGLARTVGGALPPTISAPTTPIIASPMVSDRTFPPDQFNLGQLMTAGEALPEFPAGAAGIRGLGGGTFSPTGNILPGLPSPTEFLGPGGAPAGAGELGPAAGQGADTGSLFGGTGGFGAGLGALGGLAGALTAPNDPARAFSSLAAAASLASFFDPTGISEILALVGGGGDLLSSLFGGGHTQGSHITLPGVSPGGFDTRTAGGTQTVFKSYGEGVGALSPFEQAVQAAKTPEALVAAFNQQYSPIPGQFRVESHGPQPFAPSEGPVPVGTPGEWNFMNLGGTPSFPTWSPWTAAALQNPAVLANLDVQAGMLGAPAEQPGVISALQAYLPTFPWTG